MGLLLVLIYGCATAPADKAPPAAPEPEPSAASAPAKIILGTPEEEAQYHVMAGEMAAGRQQPDVAANEFLQALETVHDPQLAARATALALAANDDALALQTARKWQTLDSTSLDARDVVVRLALRAGFEEEAYQQCTSIVHDHPGGVDDGFHHVALLLEQEPDKSSSALTVMERLVAQYPKQAGAYSAQSLLALRYDKVDLAERAARQALQLKPSREASLMLVGALVKKGDIAGSDQIVDGLLKNTAEDTELRLGYARLLIESDRHARARELLDKVLKDDPGNAEAHYSLGLMALDDHHLDEAETHFEALSQKGEHRADAEYFLGRIAELRHQLKQALVHYERVISGQQALDAAVRRASMLAKLGKLAEARNLLESLGEQFPPLAERFMMDEGEILLDAGAYDEALQLYDRALKESPDDVDVLYSRSLVYERMSRIGDAEADLRKILDHIPDDARALNALGYTLTVHTDRLDEADKLVSRALQLTPEDPAVIDSLGWLRFRQGRPKDALPLLQKAYARFPDPEVAAHLGEVLWSLGDRTQAQSVLGEASKSDPDNAQLRDTLKRLGI